MLLATLGIYAGVSAIYWGVKYRKTKDEKKRAAARKNWGKSCCECLLWPLDVLEGVNGFSGDSDDKSEE